MKYYLPEYILTHILDYAFPHYNQYEHTLLYKSFIYQILLSNVECQQVKIDVNYYRKKYKSRTKKHELISQLYLFKNKYDICIYDSLRRHNIIMDEKNKIKQQNIREKKELKEKVLKSINYKNIYNTFNIGDIIVFYKNKYPTKVNINNQRIIQNKTIKDVAFNLNSRRRYYYHSWANISEEESQIPYFNVNIPFTIFYRVIRKTDKTLFIEAIPAIYEKLSNPLQPNMNSYYACRTAKFKIIPDINTPSQNKVEKLSFRFIELDKYKRKLEDNKLPIISKFDKNNDYLFYGKKFCWYLM